MIQLAELLRATGGRVHGSIYAQSFSSFSYDSRLLSRQPWGFPDGQHSDTAAPLFVAIKTEKGDGHDFIADAVARGASGVLCQRPQDLGGSRVSCVVVNDTRQALIDYARHVLGRPGLTVVGITGSTGKTTAKELIAAVLARGSRPVFRNQGSINGRYGLSIAAGDLEAQYQLAVLELAADSFDEIRDLAALTRPQVGVLTAIGKAHLATFGSLAAIAEEKAHLLRALPPQGLAVLNADDPQVMALAHLTQAQVVTVGTGPSAHIRAHRVRATAQGLEFGISNLGFGISNFEIPISKSPLLGTHHLPLLLSALAVGLWFGLPLPEILEALAAFEPLPGHLRPLRGRHGALILDDTVNASPAATAAALQVLALFGERPRVAVLGDMWDLGGEELSAHRAAGAQAARVAHWLIVKGERAQEIATGAQEAGMDGRRIHRTYTDEDVVRFLDALSGPGGAVASPVILVKGDRPARMERIVAAFLDQPQQAGQLLVRQSAGWRQVRPLTQDRPTWVEINLEAVAGNIRRAQQLIGPEVGICAVLKADGYGHGAVGMAHTALNNGARMLAVACLAEAVVLRRAAVGAPILNLGYTPAWQARDAVRHDVVATVYDVDVAQALSRAAADLSRVARVHVKVDTGMGRLGVLPHEVLPLVMQLQALPGLQVEGMFTHFSVADSVLPEHQAHTLRQLQAFCQVLGELEAAGLRPPLVHAANSAAMVTLPRSHFNLVRLGIALYGLSPSADVPLPAGFVPALSWKTQVAQVKLLPPGSPVSYGNTYLTTGETRVAVIPVGYADGFRRGPHHWGQVLVRGQLASIIGRVTMDQTMLDVTGIDGVRQGDEVVLIGRQGEAQITVEQVAQRLGTINYEVVSEILARVPRVV